MFNVKDEHVRWVGVGFGGYQPRVNVPLQPLFMAINLCMCTWAVCVIR